MHLTGRRLAQYFVAEEISRGGMGVVYRATDTRLNRVNEADGHTFIAMELIRGEKMSEWLRYAEVCEGVMDQNIASWNPMISWLRNVEALRKAA